MGIINCRVSEGAQIKYQKKKPFFFFSSGLVWFMVQLSEALDLGVMEWEWIFQDM